MKIDLSLDKFSAIVVVADLGAPIRKKSTLFLILLLFFGMINFRDCIKMFTAF